MRDRIAITDGITVGSAAPDEVELARLPRDGFRAAIDLEDGGAPPRALGLTGLAKAAVVFGTFAGLLWLEQRRPLRRAVESPVRRNVRNLAIAGLGALTVRIVETPIVEPLSRLVVRRRWGLLQRAPLPPWLELALAVVLMDYTLYLWHVLTHRIQLLWRFHQVHHIDLDLSASTALRFHFAELALSTPWRAAQVLIIGVSPRALSTWQAFLLVAILFHHSNLRLPRPLERRLVRLIVTPRMHGIHHSAVREETDSNWSSGLTIWDRLHRTLRLDVPQAAITVGVPAYRDPDEVTLGSMLSLPFGIERPTWNWPEPLR
jgi:sterol desaturase/sphingolipid hydroxylase (fatty acid hydroxylase superfamily)